MRGFGLGLGLCVCKYQRSGSARQGQKKSDRSWRKKNGWRRKREGVTQQRRRRGGLSKRRESEQSPRCFFRFPRERAADSSHPVTSTCTSPVPSVRTRNAPLSPVTPYCQPVCVSHLQWPCRHHTSSTQARQAMHRQRKAQLSQILRSGHAVPTSLSLLASIPLPAGCRDSRPLV